MTSGERREDGGEEKLTEGKSEGGEVLRVEQLEVEYRTSRGVVRAVDDASFSVNEGERLGLLGESGSGKTTLAMALLRLTRPPGVIAGGKIVVAGRNLLDLTAEELRRVRLREIALIPQGAMSSLNPVMRIRDQIWDGILAHEPGRGRAELSARVAQLLRDVGLPETVGDRFPHELSGGMKQRVVIAIATSLAPRVIVADEPTSALDVVVQRQVMSTLARVQSELGAAMILVGHDIGLVAQFATRIGVMYAGRIVELGPVDEVLGEPFHPYTRLLIDSVPSLATKQSGGGIPGLPAGCAFYPRCPYKAVRAIEERPALVEVATGRWVACHLYPEWTTLPPVPSASGRGLDE